MARKAGDDLEKKVVRGNDKSLKSDYVSQINRSICVISQTKSIFIFRFNLGNNSQSDWNSKWRKG